MPRSLLILPVLVAAFALPAATAAGAAAAPAGCPDGTADVGTACLSTDLQTAGGQAQVDYFTAARACASQGGFLPSADVLIGAADRLRLAGRLDDNPVTATIDTDVGRGLTDWREMTSTLVTTRAGSGASGTLGVSGNAKGDPAKGEPDPAPQPADTAPSSLQYLTVVDNGDHGGFAGSEPVGDPERFRCAFNRQGSGATAPAPAGPAPAAATQHAAITATRQLRLTTLGHTGLTLQVACPADCAYTVALQVTNHTARRLGLTTSTKHAAVLATNREAESLAAGSSARERLRPTASAIGRMRYWLKRLHLRSVTVQLRLDAVEGTHHRITTRNVVVTA